MRAVSIGDYRALARARLPRFLFEYIDGGSHDEATLARNIDDLRAVTLRQRVLRDVSAISTSVELFGRVHAMPLALAPVGLAGMNRRRGEVQAAAAANQAGVPFCLSTVSVCPIAEVAAAVPPGFWFQLYMIRDRGFMRDLLRTAADHGVTTLIFTVDMPVPGTRYRDRRSGLAGAPGLAGAARRVAQAIGRPRWAWDVGVRGRPHTLGNVTAALQGRTALEDFFAWMASNFDPTVTWRDLEWVRAEWAGTLVVKGVMEAADADAAVDIGADGVVVSNHGGRQLDGVASTVAALPRIVQAVRGRRPILVDGGVRSGVDVARMLALGARMVMIGRPWAYALGADGQRGVRHMLELFERELRVTMALLGVTRIAELDASVLDDDDLLRLLRGKAGAT
jgi:L-lactate dehydrogenase (cytochrome)